jgi:hypothetical protein
VCREREREGGEREREGELRVESALLHSAHQIIHYRDPIHMRTEVVYKYTFAFKSATHEL